MKLFALAFLLFQSVSSFGATYSFASLDWPPYTGNELAMKGEFTQIVRNLLGQSGNELQVTFTPWERTINTVKTDPSYVGYFPEYYSAEMEKDFYFSRPAGVSEVVFVYNKTTPFNWNALEDLTTVGAIGIVSGYVNEENFDKMVAAGKIKADKASSDLANIKKLLAGRTAAAVIDKKVMEYLLATNPELKGSADKLAVHPKALKNHSLYICIKKSHPMAKEILDSLNKFIK